MKHVSSFNIFESQYNKKTYYHGTTKTRAENIRKIGFYKEHNVNITDDYSEALEYATMLADDENDTPEVMKVLLKKGSRPIADYGLDSMAYKSSQVIVKDDSIKESVSDDELLKRWFSAIQHNDIETVKHLINKVDINATDTTTGYFPLHAAVYWHYLDLLNLLLKQPTIDVNKRLSVNGRRTVLLIAAIEGYFDVVMILLKHSNIDVTVTASDGSNFINYLLADDDINQRKSIVNLRTYDFQKTIIDNKRYDILLMFNKYDLVNSNIKEQYPHIFTGGDLNLL